MVKYLTLALDWLWNLRALEGIRHQAVRYLGIGLSAYVVASTVPESPFVSWPDVPVWAIAGFTAWASTKGIEFAKAHPKG